MLREPAPPIVRVASLPTAKRKIDPFDIFVQGHRFFHANELIYRHFPREEVLDAAAPCAVLSAFSIELLLKCIVCIETGGIPRGHHLGSLYAKISADSRQRIEQLWDEYAKDRAAVWNNMEKVMGVPIARDLPTAIDKGSQAFEQLRYRYEPKKQPCQFYLDDLPWILGNQITTLRPDFESRPILPAPGATLLHWPEDWPIEQSEQLGEKRGILQSLRRWVSKLFSAFLAL